MHQLAYVPASQPTSQPRKKKKKGKKIVSTSNAYLGDLSPALASISHLFQTKLFGWCPGSIGTALLGGRSRGCALVLYGCHGLGRDCDRSGWCGHRDWCRGGRRLLGGCLRRLRRRGHDSRLRRGGGSSGSGGGGGSSSATALTFRRRGRRRLWGGLLLRLMWYLLRLDGGRL